MPATTSGIAQWSLDQFFAALQSVWSLANKANADLTANRQQLIRLWNMTKTEPHELMLAHQARLNPLIHQNSVLRLSYLVPLRAKYMEAVNAGSAALRQAGYSAPTLSGTGDPLGTGLGVLPAFVIVPAVAIAAVVLCLSAVSIITNLTAAQRRNTESVAAIINDQSLTPAQRTSELEAIAAQTKADAEAAEKGNPFGGLTGALVPIAAIVALAVFGPTLAKLIPGRRAA